MTTHHPPLSPTQPGGVADPIDGAAEADDALRPIRSHPHRGRLLSEVHARPFNPIPTPHRILHVAYLTDIAGTEVALADLVAFCEDRGLSLPAPDVRHYRAAFGDTGFRWERHNEFVSVSWDLAADDASIFEREASDFAGTMRLIPQPGPLLVAVDLHVVRDAEGAPWTAGFDPASLCAMSIEGGAGTVATDFKARADGFVRIRLVDDGLGPARAGAAAQRLLELETYRMMALLGLPMAQALAPAVRAIEDALAGATRDMTTSSGLDANRALLETLVTLASELEAGAAETLFRFGASRAYDRLVQSRLRALRAEPLAGFETITGFLDRRMAPAIQTCIAIEQRQDNLSRKLARAAQLLRTRVEIELEAQNQDLLRAMSERSSAQLRLQQTVEGLSVAAVSYYVLSIVYYMLQGAAVYEHDKLDPKVATALAAPVIIAFVTWIVLRIRRRHAGP